LPATRKELPDFCLDTPHALKAWDSCFNPRCWLAPVLLTVQAFCVSSIPRRRFSTLGSHVFSRSESDSYRAYIRMRSPGALYSTWCNSFRMQPAAMISRAWFTTRAGLRREAGAGEISCLPAPAREAGSCGNSQEERNEENSYGEYGDTLNEPILGSL
jgi:hypothetical protein